MDYYDTIQAVLTTIEGGVREPWDAKKLSARTGYSEAHVRDVFKRLMGVSIAKYVTGRKISNAALDVLYSGRDITDIAFDYGYNSTDTFSRAFSRVTGLNPVEFRRKRPQVGRCVIGGSMYGVSVKNILDKTDGNERWISIMNERQNLHDEHSTILYGVPKIFYGAFGGCTPYPIALKACANYMGEDIDYADAMVGCGGAFRLTWNTRELDGGNVDICFTFDEAPGETRVYEQGIRALGREPVTYKYNENTTKNDVRVFLKAQLDKGVPVIAMGMVGPPEAGLVTGYRDDGNVMLGWSVFQDRPEMAGNVLKDPCGYYITDHWWENGVNSVIAMGERTGAAITPAEVCKLALEVMRPRMADAYAKGLAAYEPFIAFLENDKAFPAPADIEKDCEAKKNFWNGVMCFVDVADCLTDGRYNAAKYFERHAEENPVYGEIAKCFKRVAKHVNDVYDVVGDWRKGGDVDFKRLLDPEVRKAAAACYKEAAHADEAAYLLLQRL